MRKVDLIIKNAYLISMNNEREILNDTCIIIEKNKITDIGKANLLEKYNSEKIIDARGKFVLPGFISTHSHLFQTLLKGLGRDKLLLDWLDSSVRRAIHKIDEECCYYAALTGCIEAIRTGTTTILDYMYCHGKEGLDDSIIQAFEDLGIRGILGRGFTDTSKFPKEFGCTYHDTEQNFFDDVRRLEKKYRDHSRISLALAPGIIWDNTEEGYKEMRNIANELNIPITMHLLETEDDDKYCLEDRGMKTVPYLEKVGILGPDFIAVHCIQMSDEDIELFKKYDVKISHNPVSNMVLAAGVAPIPKLIENGLTISLACDGSASNDTQNMLEVMKMTTLLQKVTHRDAKLLPSSSVLEMATLGGAKSINKLDCLGSIEIGKNADIIIYNPYKSAISIPVHDPISSLIYSSTPNNIETSIIDGKVVMDKNQIVNIDEEKVIYKTQKISSKLIEDVGLGNVQWGKRIYGL